MNWILFIGIFINAWWIVLFAVLPVGIKMPEKIEKGMASSAPVNPRILYKMLITTCISLVLSIILYAALYIPAIQDLVSP